MKAKTHSGLKKRVKVTPQKKMILKKPGRNHLLFHKSKGQKRGFRKGILAHPTNEDALARLLRI